MSEIINAKCNRCMQDTTFENDQCNNCGNKQQVESVTAEAPRQEAPVETAPEQEAPAVPEHSEENSGAL